MKRYLFKNKGWICFVIVIIFLKAVFTVGLAYLVKIIMDLLTEDIYNNNLNKFYTTILGAFGFMVIMMIINFLEAAGRSQFIKKVMLDIKTEIFDKIINKSFKSFTGVNNSLYISVLTNDLGTLEEKYLNSILAILSDLLIFTISAIVLCHLNIYLAVVGIFTGIIPLLIPGLTRKNLSKFRHMYSSNMDNYTASLQDVFSGFEVIKTFNLQQPILKEFYQKNSQVEKTKFKISILEGLVGALSLLSGFAAFSITLAFGVYLALNNFITIGTIIASAQLTNNVINPIVRVGIKLNQIKSTAPIIKKIEKLLYENENKNNFVSKKTFDQKITFSNVSFSYDNKKQALSNVSFEIEKGKKYAIVGQSGSGKSTIFKLIVNHYNDFSGEILIDDISVKKIAPKNLFKLVSTIHQNVFLFDTTLKENIALYQQYSDELINEAIDISGLSRLVNSLEKGENTYIGEAGNQLSGGEKQRIAIARALLRKSPILLFDEATSSLDKHTGFEIEKTILRLKDVTVLTITHKLEKELLSQYDSILVLKDGKLIESGKFNDLMDNKGYFYSLYTLSA